MKIEKVRNYNQYLLAILGTLGCLLLLLAIVTLVAELFPGRYYTQGNTQPTQGLIAGETAEQLNQENLRKQIISYESPWLIDTLNTIYIVPVSIRTLKKPVQATNERLYESADNSSISKGKNNYYRRRFDGEYANLIIYNPKEGKSQPLFDERLIIGNVNTYYFKDDILLVCYTASKDTNENGIIDLEDLRSLCIYSMKTGVMRKISDNDNQPEDYQFIDGTKNLLVSFALSQYTQKQFANYQLPKKIMKYDYEEQRLADIISQSIQEEMQVFVEGK